VETVALIAAIAAGLGAYMWRARRPEPKQLGSSFDGDAEVVLHVAGHEARTRNQPLTAYHVLYGLLQDETITNAIRSAEADPDALEDRVSGELDRIPTGAPASGGAASTGKRLEREAIELTDDCEQLIAIAAAQAHHHGRKGGCVDLAVHVLRTEAAPLLDEARWVTVLFILVHGRKEPDIGTGALAGDVHVVLRNDDYTTVEFVCDTLHRVFDLGEAEAQARMMTAHTAGRSVIGRYRLDEARAKIDEARQLAHAGGHPLWIGLEPV
jgi:ATP-dependent Clp protease adaptor protein ClpS